MYGVPVLVSITTLGSIALVIVHGSVAFGYSVMSYERTTSPWSVQEPGKSVLEVARPMAEFWAPKVETE